MKVHLVILLLSWQDSRGGGGCWHNLLLLMLGDSESFACTFQMLSVYTQVESVNVTHTPITEECSLGSQDLV